MSRFVQVSAFLSSLKFSQIKILQKIKRSNPNIQMCYVCHFKVQVRYNWVLRKSVAICQKCYLNFVRNSKSKVKSNEKCGLISNETNWAVRNQVRTHLFLSNFSKLRNSEISLFNKLLKFVLMDLCMTCKCLWNLGF